MLSYPALCGPTDCNPPVSSAMEISRQEYWSGLPFHTPGDLPDSGIEPTALVLPALAGRFFTTVPAGKPKTRREVGILFFLLTLRRIKCLSQSLKYRVNTGKPKTMLGNRYYIHFTDTQKDQVAFPKSQVLSRWNWNRIDFISIS